MPSNLVPIFDLDGTLLDSDAALMRPFVTLGIPEDAIGFGHPIEIECERLGISLDDYVAAYDTDEVQPFDGIREMLATIERWAVCSNKHPLSGHAELDRLGWTPEVALFSRDFDGRAKALGPVLDRMDLAADDAVFVGDTNHDQSCAQDAGTSFCWAGWNRRTMEWKPAGVIAHTPAELSAMLDSPDGGPLLGGVL